MTHTPFNDDDDDNAYRPELPNLWERTPSVREQLYAEENQRLDKKKKAAENSTSGLVYPLININILPARSQQSTQPPTNTTMPTGPSHTESIVIDGLLDVAVVKYTE
ncbi:hypothetical protein N7507_009794 [Penicillium longicatenatum]|nr:hypothetical protein N7507_009794 [Penicillium longicatenatum]